MTTYVPELNKKETLRVDRELYEALQDCESDFCFDFAKLRSVTLSARSLSGCFHGSRSSEYFADEDRREELISMFYVLINAFGVVSDYLDRLEKSSDSVACFCSSAGEVK